MLKKYINPKLEIVFTATDILTESNGSGTENILKPLEFDFGGIEKKQF